VETTAELICTPHQGELVGMGGETSADWRERRDLVADFAAELGHTLLVKGHDDVVSDGETTRVSRTGNPGMTVGGTGDVLAGITGALAATQPPIHAAAIGAYVNGRAGDIVHDRQGNGLVATDLIDAIPGAMER
jgi:NAD(P)H-hydrate epimerase